MKNTQLYTYIALGAVFVAIASNVYAFNLGDLFLSEAQKSKKEQCLHMVEDASSELKAALLEIEDLSKISDPETVAWAINKAKNGIDMSKFAGVPSSKLTKSLAPVSAGEVNNQGKQNPQI